MSEQTKDKSTIKKIIDDIKEEKLVLPNFQRNFVWTIKEQKNLLCSIFANIPFGQTLELIAQPDTFSATKIGTDIPPEIDNNREIRYLLDGQQRVSTIVNAFSNIVFKNGENFEKIKSENLKYRFFIKLPKDKNKNCVFGSRDFDCKKISGDNYIPPKEFLEQIGESKKLNKTEAKKSWYSPYVQYKDAKDRESFYDHCLTDDTDYYLIPLFLLGERDLDNLLLPKLETLLEKISEKFLSSRFENPENPDSKVLVDNWQKALVDFLKSCYARQIRTESFNTSETQKALDTFSIMNNAGTKLNIFDLIIARTYSECVEYKHKGYREFCQSLINKTQYLKKMLNKQGKISENKAFIATLLNVLSCYCNDAYIGGNKQYDTSLSKESEYLKLDPKDLVEKLPDCIKAIEKASELLNTKCGIRKLGEVGYRYILDFLSIACLNKEKSPEDGILIAWYWTMVFSGEFTSQQNENFKKWVNRLIGVERELIKEIEKHCEDYVFKTDSTRVEQMTYLERKNNGTYNEPYLNSSDEIKIKGMNKFVCQYFLSKRYTDPFRDKGGQSEPINVNASDLEVDHIFPLDGATAKGERTKKLRDKSKKGHFLNSPMNFMYVTKETNIAMSGKDPASYWNDFDSGTKDTLLLDQIDINNPQKALYERFEKFQQAVKQTITTLLE